MAKSVKYTVNFLDAKEEDLYKYDCTKCTISIQFMKGFMKVCRTYLPPIFCLCRIEIPFKFHMMHSGLVHGLAFWFDVAFIGSV